MSINLDKVDFSEAIAMIGRFGVAFEEANREFCEQIRNGGLYGFAPNFDDEHYAELERLYRDEVWATDPLEISAFIKSEFGFFLRACGDAIFDLTEKLDAIARWLRDKGNDLL